MKNLESGYYWLTENETLEAKISQFDLESDCWTFCGSDLFYTTDEIRSDYIIKARISEPV